MIEYAKDLLQPPPDPTLLDNLLFGVETMLIGMAIVFSVLILLWGVLELFGFVSKKITEKTNEPKKAELPEITINENIENIEAVNESEEDELVAVISAAVAAALEKPVSGFRVVSFKKRNDWKFI
ncbi:MAG: OadG family protein [Oscillospiraceae bacterium]|nr:OadG family protein [Oscillospiraceae bacterium]MCL2158830.1 OadG family protein [Oscillospiraceae bacterium]